MGEIESNINKIINKYKTNDPFVIAKSKKIEILFLNLGKTYGYYRSYKRIKIIHINNRLDELFRRYVCAHELGHALLHPNVNTAFLKKNTFYSIGRIEREANEFAINLLLSNINLQDYETKYDVLRENGIPYEMERFL